MRGIPKIVLERIKRRATSSQDNRQSAIENRQFQHPDANLLTAFLEGALTERERRQVLDHLAECADCREIAALTLPAAAGAVAPGRLPVQSAWSVWQVLGWGVLAAALGAVVVVAVLRQHSGSRLQSAFNNSPRTMSAKSGETTPRAPQPLPPQPASKPAPRRAKGRSLESTGEMAELKKAAAASEARQLTTLSANLGEQVQTPPGVPLRPPASAPSPSYSRSAGIPAGVNTELMRAAPRPSALEDRPPVPVYDKRGPASKTGPSTQVRVNALQGRFQAGAFRSPMKSVVALPSALWSISQDGKLQRSGDSGKNWEEVPVNDKVEFRVVQTNGREIWAGGTGGALYHSSDGGATWSRVNLASESTSTTEAIVSINCSPPDVQHITVKTASGQQWISEDGGQHWRAVTSEE